MTTLDLLASQAMPPHDIDMRTRQRIAANLRFLKHKFEFDSDAAIGKKLGLSRDAVNRALKGERTVGLDFLLRVQRKLHASLDWIVENEPGAKWYEADTSGRQGRPKAG